MPDRVRRWITYANVTSTLALFVALGGSSYAALRVGSRQIVNNSIRGRDVRNHSLTRHDLARNTLDGSVIRESRLGRVPRASQADDSQRLGGLSAQDLKVKCPPDTFAVADVCVETQARAPASYGSAVLQCADTGSPPGIGRRLPTHSELRVALTGATLAAGGELTSEVYPSATTSGELDVLFVTTQTGAGVGLTPNTAAGGKAFRCVADPSN